MFGSDTDRNTAEIMSRRFIPGNQVDSEQYTLELANGASPLLGVDVEATVHSNGYLVFKLSSQAADADDIQFSMWLVMKPEVSVRTASNTTTSSSGNTETSRTVTATISTISWTLGSIMREEPQFG
jgi:hypothetical protein